jgi:hypothetical protein
MHLGLLTLRAQQHIYQYKDEYTFNGLLCGPLLLKIIIRTVTGNSRVAIPAIISRMNDIDAYAAEVEGNVEMITEFFTEHLGQLKANRASIYNPMEILFKGLLAVPCKKFCRYIRDKEDMYNDESLTLTPEELVIMEKQRYMIMKTKGTFSNSITSRDDEIIELWAELNQIRALAENIPQVANDKSPDEVLAFAVRLSSGKLHKSSEPWKQVPGATTTAWVAAQNSSCQLSPKEPSTCNKSCCQLSPEELSVR